VIRAADPAALAHAVTADDSADDSARAGRAAVVVEVPKLGSITLTADDLVVTQTPLEGWGVATAAGETVALDLAVSDSLRAEGWAREVVRLIQDARKSDGLQVSDRIELRWATPDGDLAAALAAHAELIAGEVLAVSFGPGEGAGDAAGPWYEHADDDLGLRFRLAVSG
jgi:isoleucyl-tRNA synthetase